MPTGVAVSAYVLGYRDGISTTWTHEMITQNAELSYRSVIRREMLTKVIYPS